MDRAQFRSLKLPSFDQAKARIAPGEYARTLENVTLLNIMLESVDASVFRERLGQKPLTLRVKLSGDTATVGDNHADLFIHCTVSGFAGRVRAVSIRVLYRLQLTSAETLSPEFLAIYGVVSGIPQVWPYLRELADTLTGRMGLPRLVLPLLMRSDHSVDAGKEPADSE